MATRRYQVIVPDSGLASETVQIGNVPNCLGWELSISTLEPAGMHITARTVCQDEWQNGGPGLNHGPFLVTSGGKIFIPYPSIALTCNDAAAAGVGQNATVRIIARPVLEDGWSQGSSQVFNWLPEPIAAGAAATVQIPPNVIGYKVTTDLFGPVTVSLETGFGAISSWVIGDPSASNHDEGGQNWRDVLGAGGQIGLQNNSLSAMNVTPWFLWDFRRCT